MDEDLPPRPRPARSNRPAPRSQPAPRSRYLGEDGGFDFDFEFDAPPRPRPRSRRRRPKRQSAIRPLHVLLLAILVIGLIAFTTKLLTGGGDSSAANAGTTQQTVSATGTGKKTAGKKTASATKATGQNAAAAIPKVQALPPPAYQSGAKAAANQPSLAATSWVALDVDRNQIVLARGETDKRPIASLTKMMTGLLTAEAGNMWHPVTVSATAAGVEPNKDGLIIGNRYPRGILLYSALLGSNNDAAAALGEDLGGGNYQRYYKMMNARAKELGMTGTHYGSASGLNDATNWSTARDQAIILSRALGNPTFAEAVGTWHHTVRWPDSGKMKTYENHDKMLEWFPGTIGGKTGFTTLAGGCLAVAVKRGGHTIVGVVLHSNDIWGDMPKLINAAFKRSP
ncbi:MAG: D-alanyl-D-alanine carboxypeptidase family protein [Gaiellales bacterium]